MVTDLVIRTILGNTEAGAVLLLGLYLGYEIRLGVLREVRENQRVLGIAVYRIVEEEPSFDEAEFRELLCGDSEIFPNDFSMGERPMEEAES